MEDKSAPLSALILTLKKLSIYVAKNMNGGYISSALRSHSHSEKAIHLRRQKHEAVINQPRSPLSF